MKHFDDLFTDSKTGRLSTSKIWLHICYAALTYVFVKQAHVSYEEMLAYGAIVGGNHVAIFWLKRKYNGIAERDPNSGEAPCDESAARRRK